jgi:hypothetical protein
MFRRVRFRGLRHERRASSPHRPGACAATIGSTWSPIFSAGSCWSRSVDASACVGAWWPSLTSLFHGSRSWAYLYCWHRLRSTTLGGSLLCFSDAQRVDAPRRGTRLWWGVMKILAAVAAIILILGAGYTVLHVLSRTSRGTEMNLFAWRRSQKEAAPFPSRCQHTHRVKWQRKQMKSQSATQPRSRRKPGRSWKPPRKR